MARPNNEEVASIERRDRPYSQSFGGSYNRSIHSAERQIAILIDQFSHSRPIGRVNLHRNEVSVSQVFQQAQLRAGTQSPFGQVSHF
jgi:hypothetical protein